MSWEPITLEEIKQLGMRMDSEFVYADSVDELYGKLNTHFHHEGWVMIRSPGWCGDKLVALVVKPRLNEMVDSSNGRISV